MSLSSGTWRRILREIEDRHVIPVVGPGLLSLDVGGTTTPLFRYLAVELFQRLEGIDEEALPENYMLRDIVGEYLRNPRNDPADLYIEIRDILKSQDWTTPEPLRKLAAIRHFSLFVTTTFDSFMERALNEVLFDGADGTQTYAYNRRSQLVDLPSNYRPDEVPTVFQLFGHLNPANDFAIKEDDILHFTHRLQSRDLRPQRLFDELRTKHLLLLGCGFPGWLTRFFLAATKGENLFSDKSRGVIVDEFAASDPRLSRFLERHSMTHYADGTATEFVDELHDRWTERFRGHSWPAATAKQAAPVIPEPIANDSPPHPDQATPLIKPESVFLSFSSRDREQAQAIRDALEVAGIDVWFDSGKLEAGDDYHEQILLGIERCSFFLPLISKHTASTEKRFFRREWKKAIEEAQAWPSDYPFIQPIVIDETPPESTSIPREFRERQWQRLEQGCLPQAFVELTKKRIRDQRRAARST